MQQNVETTLPTPKSVIRRNASFNDYKWGKVPIHPLLYTKRQRFFAYGTTIVPGSSNALKTADIAVDKDSHFLCEAIQIYRGGAGAGGSDIINILNCGVTYYSIQDLSYDKRWANDTVPIYDGSGLGSNTKYLTDPILVKPSTVLRVGIDVGANGTFYVGLIGRKIYGVTDDEWGLVNKKQWYSYIMRFPTIPKGGAEQIVTTQVFSDADFVLKRLLGSLILGETLLQSVGGGANVNPIFNVRFTAMDKNLQNKKISVLIGTGEMQGFVNSQTFGSDTVYSPSFGEPVLIMPPLKIPRNTIIEVRIANPDLNVDLGVPLRMTFEGIHVYD